MTAAEDYDKAFRERTLDRMRHASSVFYALAAQAGCHGFLEFTGLMNEYIKVCEEAEARGAPWLHANVHSGKHLQLEPYHVEYLREKLECIYGEALLRPA